MLIAQAAALTGKNRSSILRAIKRGTLTGTKDHNDVWHVDPEELARVFRSRANDEQTAPTLADYRLRTEVAEQRLADLRETFADMRRQRDDMEKQRDKWEAIATRLSRPSLNPAPAPGWRWPREERDIARQAPQPPTQRKTTLRTGM